MAAIVAMVCAVAQSPAVAASPAATELDPVPMVTIPAGGFVMGNPEGKGRADEWPQRSVYLDAFAIDQVEVTNERYLALIPPLSRFLRLSDEGSGLVQMFLDVSLQRR